MLESELKFYLKTHLEKPSINFIWRDEDNTKLFDYFIKWGFDGGHAFETTSNVDIPYEKKTHGDCFTIVGGIGIDYLLTERSKPEEVVEATKRRNKV